MEDRYEIRGKIGQGGLGAVYRGYDTRMNREVAIKRISPSGEDAELQAESTRQLIKEAGALASLQHPHIVTVYDVGADEDGPYVVMELISGKTLDELIERAPLTWPDFRELALQTQEALIAAQELNLIHSDLKPSNLMLTWLPSGKFQVKIVDFGLATLAQSQNKQDMESIEAVFGSVFFMPPEQFERVPLDARSDIYSMGCVYYQALTGTYPFDGKTGNEVMGSHLHHTVKPLQEVREGIPIWACEWIMWQINRLPQDRPESAREALSIFLKNDRIPNSAMSLGIPKPAPGPPRPRLVIPGSAPPTKAVAQAKLVQTSHVTTLAKEGAAITHTAPQALAPPEGFKPSVHTSLQELPDSGQSQGQSVSDPGPHPASASGTQRMARPAQAEVKPFKLGKTAKAALAIGAGILLLLSSVLLLKLSREKRAQQVLTELLAQAQSPGAGNVKVTAATLRILLESMIGNPSDTQLQSIGKALALADATDGTDVDSRIANFATKRPELTLAAKEILIGKVLQTRNNPVIMPEMLEMAAAAKDPALVVSALQAVRQMAGDGQFTTFLKLLESPNRNDRIRDAAELNLEGILRRSKNPAALAKQLASAKESTVKPEIQQALQRLLSVSASVNPQDR